MLDHPELDTPPKFKFKLISSFSDPLTRQISEAVRIEQRGEQILNSKSEFNRCRVPRLKIDMEGWRAGKEREKLEKARKAQEEISTTVGVVEEAAEPDWLEDQLELELADAEKESRRVDRKRKMVEEPRKPEKKRKEKKIKFEILTHWGEMLSIQEEENQPQNEEGRILDDWLVRQEVEKEERIRDWLQEDTNHQPHKRMKQMIIEMPILVKKAGKKVLDEKAKKNSFKFNKKGKLTRGEKNEIKKTSKNIFDWFSSKDNSRVDEDMEISTIIEKDITEDNDELGSMRGGQVHGPHGWSRGQGERYQGCLE